MPSDTFICLYQKNSNKCIKNLRTCQTSDIIKSIGYINFNLGFQCRRDTIMTKLCEKNIIIQLLIKSNRILTLKFK